MSFAENYFSKQKTRINKLQFRPEPGLQFVVVIPAWCEPDITNSLDSLWNCLRPAGNTEIIVVVNYPENSGKDALNLSNESEIRVNDWILKHQDPALRTAVIKLAEVPVSKAGVGFARKTGMDAALRRFEITGNNNGLIICFDADCICDSNYFVAIEAAKNKYLYADGFNIYFEHPCEGNDHPPEVYEAIIQYELHLRYMNQFLRFAGFPFAFHTVGSAFAVKASAYAAQGGMNTRKAGEDFYFLHKIIPLGNFHEINDTRVIPSPRKSFRVPFGTGAAMGKIVDSESRKLNTYAPESFLLLKSFFENSGKLFKAEHTETERIINSVGEPLKEFLIMNNAASAINEINRNCSTAASFKKRFYMWFNAFRIIKFLNYSQRTLFDPVPVVTASKTLLKLAKVPENNLSDARELLHVFREADRNGINAIRQQ